MQQFFKHLRNSVVIGACISKFQSSLSQFSHSVCKLASKLHWFPCFTRITLNKTNVVCYYSYFTVFSGKQFVSQNFRGLLQSRKHEKYFKIIPIKSTHVHTFYLAYKPDGHKNIRRGHKVSF